MSVRHSLIGAAAHHGLAARHPELFPELFGHLSAMKSGNTAPTQEPKRSEREAAARSTPGGLLVLDALTKRFGALAALDGISLGIVEGEFLGICGPNGAGKSTLLSAATGHLRTDSGQITLDGQTLTHAPPHRFCAAGIARMFQRPEIFTSLTVRQNVETGVAFGHRSRLVGARGADLILDRCGLSTLAGRPAAGADLLTRKRIMLAAALATNPRILFLDEPLAGLNDAEIETFVDLLTALRRDFALTIVMVEHKVRALAAVSDRILVMNFGRMLRIGTPAEVLRDPEVVSIYLGKRHVA